MAMPFDYEVIVVGLGAMGSSSAYHLAKRGLRVLGLDRFHPPHNFGSSHGLTRIIREAYFEDPLYVPLVQRSYELWADLEKQSGTPLLLKTGGLMIGPPDGALVSGASRSAEQHHLDHEILNSTNLAQKFPAFNVHDDPIAVWEPRAGILFPERAIQTHLDLAAKLGARLLFNAPVVKWEPLGENQHSRNAHSNLEPQNVPPLPKGEGRPALRSAFDEGGGEGEGTIRQPNVPAEIRRVPQPTVHGNGVRVFTDANSYTANHLVLSPGAWMNSLSSTLKLPLSVERQVLFWFKPASHLEMFRPDQFPIFIRQYAPDRFFYGFPDLGDGVKVAFHHQGGRIDPNALSQEVAANEIEEMRHVLSEYLPAANGELQSTAVCMYTNTPDEHFILDYHPEFPQVIVASPCSGHGFKFSPVIGEMIAEMVQGKQPRFARDLFKIGRFSD